MARSFALTGLRFRIASAAVILGTLLGGTRPSAQAPSDDPAGLLEALLDRAAATAPGTYQVTATAIEPETSALPVLLQADVMRGPEQTVRAAIVLAAAMPQPYVARFRVLATSGPAANEPRVVGEADGMGPAGTIRLVREFTVGPGEYEVHAVIGHPRSGGGVVISLSKFRLTVPDVWGGPLAVTPLALGEAVGAAERRPGTRPFEFEPTALTPATSNRFAQNERIHVAFRVYNWTPDQNATPDLTVDYVFHQQGPRGPGFFNKMKPQRLHADTLGEVFDPADGAVTAGMTVPLVSFPFGEFELTVRVTDNRSKQSSERPVRFVVAP